jgi:hypothetical protein
MDQSFSNPPRRMTTSLNSNMPRATLRFFAHNKANLDSTSIALTRYYCSSSRASFLTNGVLIHYVKLAPDN